jgi:predicted PurR-regulated permease PerM
VLLYFLIIVSVLGLFAVLTAPDIIREASDFVTRLKSDNVWTVVLEKMRHGLG